VSVVPRIRAERARDVAAIAVVTRAAFATHPHSDHTEEFVIAALRARGMLTLSLVAELAGEVVGHIAFSPVAGVGEAWFGLGPLAVDPPQQRRGIGSALVRAGLDALRARGAAGCVVFGSPAYYGRFGFTVAPAHAPEGLPGEFFQVLAFGAVPLAGRVRYDAAFDAKS
jgi:putative acetyltransferase